MTTPFYCPICVELFEVKEAEVQGEAMSKQQLNWLDRMPVQREELERIAYIIGRSSAAQQALDDADTHSGEVQFWRIGQTIVVEKLPTASVEDAK